MAEIVSARRESEKAVEICRRFELGEGSRALLRDDLTANVFLDLLIAAELYDDALKFVAHSLPIREAVWWGCLCVWKSCRPHPPEKEAAALEAVVHWVIEPAEEHRRLAETAGQKAGADTPAGGLALAAFWSEGSMAPAGSPEVAAPQSLTAQTLAAVLNLAVTRAEGDTRPDHQRLFLQLGREVAGGKNRWTS
jgi:hypothetical protein